MEVYQYTLNTIAHYKTINMIACLIACLIAGLVIAAVSAS